MKIAIEAQRIFREKKHGMDFVALETIRQLQIIDTENEYFIFVKPGKDKCLESTKNFHIIELACPTYILWEQIALPFAISKIKPDLLHCTSNTAPLFCNVPLVLTLHDIIFLELRQQKSKSLYQNLGWYYRRFVVPPVLNKCEKIITVSKFECNRIKEALKLPNNKITYIYNGFGNHFYNRAETKEITKKYLPDDQYLFFLGNTDPKKNTRGTLIAYSQYVAKSKKALPLLIADLNEAAIDAILNEAGIQEIKPMLRYPGYITNADLPSIYSGAKIFLYTSFRESFGIPLLEAMACGTPVITSNTSAMPEIAGEGALFADPFVPESISELILKLEEDHVLYEQMLKNGLNRVQQFSWSKTAKETLSLYHSIYKSGV